MPIVPRLRLHLRTVLALLATLVFAAGLLRPLPALAQAAVAAPPVAASAEVIPLVSPVGAVGALPAGPGGSVGTGAGSAAAAGTGAAGTSAGALPSSAAAPAASAASAAPALDRGDTAWMMAATSLVLLMTLPGLALFYAGMVRQKNILATMAQVLATTALVSLLWFALGYSLAFHGSSPWLGDFVAAGLGHLRYGGAGTLGAHALAPSVPEPVFVMFQLSFAVITPALIVGAFAERLKFSALLWFMALWSLAVYAPVAHWVWAPGGWLAGLGTLDFAGGTVVHLNAGIAGLVAARFVGPRRGYGEVPLPPSNLGLTMAGAGLLWVGWMGFNGGSALAADGRAGLAMLCTQLAAAAATLAWMGAEWLLRGTPTLLGLCSGAVAGLVAITPASGYVTPASAVLIGAVAGVACYWGATGLKRLLRADDSLDVFGVHGVGGLVGALATGLLADPRVGGASGSIAAQAAAVAVTLAYGGVVTALILGLLDATLGLRVNAREEELGLDLALHGERVG